MQAHEALARLSSLLRMCLILAIVGVVFPSSTPRRSVYGDQGQEVAWEVEQEQCVARQEDNEEQEVARKVRCCIELTKCIVEPLGVNDARRAFGEHETGRKQHHS